MIIINYKLTKLSSRDKREIMKEVQTDQATAAGFGAGERFFGSEGGIYLSITIQPNNSIMLSWKEIVV